MVRSPAGEPNQPVFVDGSGLRRRLATLIGVAIGVGLAISLGLVVAGLFGVSPVRVPGLPDTDRQPVQVQQPAPTPDGPEPSGTRTPSPVPRLTPTAGTPTPNQNPTHPRGGPSRSHPTKPA
jgi:hypothetical protein